MWGGPAHLGYQESIAMVATHDGGMVCVMSSHARMMGRETACLGSGRKLMANGPVGLLQSLIRMWGPTLVFIGIHR